MLVLSVGFYDLVNVLKKVLVFEVKVQKLIIFYFLNIEKIMCLDRVIWYFKYKN